MPLDLAGREATCVEKLEVLQKLYSVAGEMDQPSGLPEGEYEACMQGVKDLLKTTSSLLLASQPAEVNLAAESPPGTLPEDNIGSTRDIIFIRLEEALDGAIEQLEALGVALPSSSSSRAVAGSESEDDEQQRRSLSVESQAGLSPKAQAVAEGFRRILDGRQDSRMGYGKIPDRLKGGSRGLQDGKNETGGGRR
ncbi:hypothetical protein FA15DRAFT_757998 [Coprinopsis marcescibilis]|uniref:Uncharacterized protein n=1 Tax=Coprinopsis marcescibilis TaxID=230819 RepID=A0A5C3KQ01_COPMA|nr:hypothetical protein FA15DRAFT_757998 [Coprinopsis marcescibilis]